MTDKEFVFGSLFLISNKLQALGDYKLKVITLKQWFLLVMLSNMEKSNPNINELADFTGTSRQNTRKIVGVLEKKGYVKVQTSANDKRNLEVSLTQKTYDFFNEFEKTGEEILEKLFDGASQKNIAATKETFEVLIKNIEKRGYINEKNSSNL